ncbi:MAG: purine-nucleoside phosphorylase [Chloroflexi bacterium]|nr:purine-nucleoside phosphorylase [Chloroflexota bacterium]MCI0644390.1 purine-nucleoside phosphorylase [Chloroflexota bacterium]MCI0727357.1 purine-nucleoside phosphorylase [Chloroflexota bacterium]
MPDFFTRVQIEGAAAIVRNRSRYQPTIGLVLGSGLNSLADSVENPDIIPYEQIPHWPISTVPGHAGRLILGQLEDKTVMVLQGRAHFYEGYPMSQVTLPVRVMQLLGIQTLILTNAAGGMNENFRPGDLMLIKDHLNLLGLAGENPLRGPNDDMAGPRFPGMTEAYDPELRQLAHESAAGEGFTLQEGIYAFVAGPSYETPAELRFLRLIGADAVGMSTVPSVVVARHAGMRVLGISTITNLALPDPPPGTQISHEEVLETGKMVIPHLTALIRGVLRRL